jgi:hypothetical protein
MMTITKDVQQPKPRVTNNRKRKRTEATIIPVSSSLPKASSTAAIILQRCSPDCADPCGSKRVTVEMWQLLHSHMEALHKGLRKLGLEDHEAACFVNMMCTPLVEAVGPALDATLACYSASSPCQANNMDMDQCTTMRPKRQRHL